MEPVSQYKYLGIILDHALSFKPHFQHLVKKLKLKLGFYFRNFLSTDLHSSKRYSKIFTLAPRTYCY